MSYRMIPRKSRLIWMIMLIGFTCAHHLVGAQQVESNAFESAFPSSTRRAWIGPEYFANRLQDWHIDDGFLACVESNSNRPLRTVHLLTHRLSADPEAFEMKVISAPVDSSAESNPDAWSGFLIGAGNENVDYRLTALVHHRPAEDGGLLAVIDGRGIVAFRDNTLSPGRQGFGSGLSSNDAPLIRPLTTRGEGSAEGIRSPVELHLKGRWTGQAYSLTLTATEASTSRFLSETTIENVAPSMVDGSLALVSHLGPIDSPVGFRFRDWQISGPKLAVDESRLFGPILTSQYTLSRGTLKMTAQAGPLGPDDTQLAELQIQDDSRQSWRTIASGELTRDSYTFPFRVENWDSSSDTPYRIAYSLRTSPGATKPYYREGVIRAEPWEKDSFVVAAFTGHKIFTGGLKWNENGIWFPHSDIVTAVENHRPDFLFFSGDQIYESDLTPAHANPIEKAILDYHYKWFRWCWAFGDLTRDIPAVTIPDDHDVYHGNVWGAGGKAARAEAGMTAQDSGGYRMSPRFVNLVHRTQTSHLPDPVDPEPVLQDISVYTTSVEYAGMSFAVIADRQWKSSPTVMVPEGNVVNGWFQNPEFDPATQSDVPDAVLLGERQLDFLHDWSTDWSNKAWMKVVLSQTVFSNVATLPQSASSGAVLPNLPALAIGEYPDNYKLAADADSNAWPQTGRNKALREMRRGFALHIAGDQHLGSTIQYGIDEWRDGGFALCVPSVANTWPRRWFPPQPGLNRALGSPRYTGDFKDGFGNYMTVMAVSNPHLTGIEPTALHDRAPGYGIVRFNRETRDITIECWPRFANELQGGSGQYPGWPITINQLDNDGRKPVGQLPMIEVLGMVDPVIQVVHEPTGEVVYALRIKGQRFRPEVFTLDSHMLRIGDPDTATFRLLRGIRPLENSNETIIVDFR